MTATQPTPTRRPKQTAGNNVSLRAIKAWMNAPIYRACLHLMNTADAEAVRTYLRKFFRPEAWGRVEGIMAGEMPNF